MNTQHLLRPEKILWVFPTISDNWIEAVPSKSARKLIRKYPDVLKQNNLEFVWKRATEADYLDWLEFYRQKMLEQDHEVLAQPGWYKQKLQENKEVYYLECRDLNTLERKGGSIIVKTEEGKWTSAYKATERLDLGSEHNVSLGLLFDIEYMTYAQSQHPAEVTAGSSRNAFGYTNTIGYLLSKLRKGFLPTIHKDNLVTTFPRHEGKPAIWYVRHALTQEEFFLLSGEESAFNEEFFHFCEVQKLKYVIAPVGE